MNALSTILDKLSGLRWLTRAPDYLIRRTLGPPPRNDRGIELDLRTHALLRLMARTGMDSIHQSDAPAARRHYDRSTPWIDRPAPPTVTLSDAHLPGDLPCRVYRPRAAGPSDPLPVLLWLHGGGFVIGSLETHVGLCGALAERGHCVVVALEYRKAPEHAFPTAIEDCLATLRHFRDTQGRARLLDWGGDPDRLAVGGDSAGANLSTVLCQLLRDTGESQPLAQILVYPATDSTQRRASHELFARDFLLSSETLAWFMDHYLPAGTSLADPRVSPLCAESLEGLAPALIRTAGFDPLRDEGEAYAMRLREAGVAVDLRCHERLIHGFVSMGGILPAAREAVDDLGDDLRRLLHHNP